MTALLQARIAHFARTETCASARSADGTEARSGALADEERVAQRRTGELALLGVWQVHAALRATEPAPAPERGTERAPLLGARDLAMLRRLVSVAFTWLVGPAVEEYDAAYVKLHAEAAPAAARFSDADADVRDDAQAAQALAHVAQTLERLFAPQSAAAADGAGAALPLSAVATTDVAVLVLRLYLADILRVALRIAFRPGADRAQTAPAEALLRALVAAVPTPAALPALRSAAAPRALQAQQTHTPAYVREQAGRLLSAQLQRPEGVRALLSAVLGASDRDLLEADDPSADDAEGDAHVRKMEGVATVLATPPRGMPRPAYYAQLVPSLLGVLDPAPAPPTTPVHGLHRRAAAFTLMRMHEREADAVHAALDPLLYAPLVGEVAGGAAGQAGGAAPAAGRVDRAVRLLAAAAALAPPSPAYLRFLVTPVVGRLLTLDTFLQRPGRRGAPLAEPDAQALDMLRAEVHDLLHIWLRLACTSEDLDKAVQQATEQTYAWTVGAGGTVHLVPAKEAPRALDTMQALPLEQLARHASGSGGLAGGLADKDNHSADAATHQQLAQSLDLAVQPTRLAALLRGAQRQDLGGALLLSALHSYERVQTQVEANMAPEDVSVGELERRSVLYLQVVYALLDAFGTALLEEDLERVLQFIDFACSDAPTEAAEATDTAPGKRPGGALDEMMHVDATPGVHDPELLTTALSLLLSLLERDTTLRPSAHPMLDVIGSKVERLRDAGDDEVRALAQEASVALAARRRLAGQAGGAGPQRPRSAEVYQEALRHLQDPILPVRAHGLGLLTQLVTRRSDARGASEREVALGEELDPALLPAILDMFLEAIQDDESFLYLNAVRGLAQMAVSWRSQVLRPLVAVYVGGGREQERVKHALSYGRPLTQREADKRLRVGEALVQVLQRLGDAAAANVCEVVDPLLVAVRNPVFPATLRSSFISVLGTCVELAADALAAAGAAAQMVELCVDLVSLESVRRTAPRRERVRGQVSGQDAAGRPVVERLGSDEEEDAAARDASSGIDRDPKQPQLRRAALLLLAVLLRGTRHQLEDHLEAQQRAGPLTDAEQPLSALRLPGGGTLPTLGDSEASAPRGGQRPPPPLVREASLPRIERVCSYVAHEDTDALVRHQAHDCVAEAQQLQAAWLQVAGGS